MDKGKNSWRGLILRGGFLLVCLASLAAYFVHNKFLGAVTAPWPYHRALFHELYPAGFDGEALRGLLATLPRPHSAAAGLELLLFAAACLTTGWLAWLHLGRDLPRGATVLLFTFAAAVLPPQLLALLRFPLGEGWLCTELLLGIALLPPLLLAVAIIPRRGRLQPRAAARGGEGILAGLFWRLAFGLTLSLMLLVAFWKGACSVSGYDAIAYHLPLAAHWLKESALGVGSLPQSFLPVNQSLLLRWLLDAGGDPLAFLAPWAATVVALYAVWDLTRATGRGRAGAWAAVAAAASLPWLMNLASTAYADTAAAALLLFSLRFLLIWRDGDCRRLAPLVAAGLAMGLGLGTKFSLLPAGLVISIAAAVLLARSEGVWLRSDQDLPGTRHTMRDRRIIVKSVLVYVLAILPGCGFWLLRNTIIAGNPLFPVSLLGMNGYTPEEIVGIGDTLSSLGFGRLLLPWTEAIYGSILDDGVGPLFTGFLLPLLLLRPLLRRLGGGKASPGADLIHVVALGSLFLFLLTDTPLVRYGIVGFLLTAVLCGELWERWSSPVTRAFLLAVFLLGALLQLNTAAGGALYHKGVAASAGAPRFNLPAAVDSLPPSRILSAAGSQYCYGLMGADHRHRVFNLFRVVVPGDPERFDADYVLLREHQEEAFLAVEAMELVERVELEQVSLWRRASGRDRGEDYPIVDLEEIRNLLPMIMRAEAVEPRTP
jgi:hypothetical protein